VKEEIKEGSLISSGSKANCPVTAYKEHNINTNNERQKIIITLLVY
jgi:hypothetical protein